MKPKVPTDYTSFYIEPQEDRTEVELYCARSSCPAEPMAAERGFTVAELIALADAHVCEPEAPSAED